MNTIRVLLVEDDHVYSMLLKKRLQSIHKMNFEVDQTALLGEAMNLVQDPEKNYDVILLDLNLPDSEGIETLQRLVYIRRSIPVVVLTAADGLAMEAMDAGAHDYLVKGELDAHLVPRVIHYALERSKADERLRQRTEELEKLNRVMLSRELQMIQIKREIQSYQRRLSRL